MSRIAPIRLPEADRVELERLVRDRNTPQKVVWRSRIVLLSAAGRHPPEIAAAVGKSELTVRRWRRRYLEKGLRDWSRTRRDRPARSRLPRQWCSRWLI